MLFLNHTAVRQALSGAPGLVRPVVESAYRSLARGTSISASVTLLPIPNPETSRFVSLPAYYSGEGNAGAIDVAGAKWVSNFRGNIARGLRPFSTLVVVSDTETGLPMAVMECTEINLRRTAASAYLAAESVGFDPGNGVIGIVGAGELAKAFCDELIETYPGPHKMMISDIVDHRAQELATVAQEMGIDASVQTTDHILRDASILVLATSAEEPFLDVADLPNDHRMILNISADDIATGYFSRVLNVTDRAKDIAILPVGLGLAINEGLDPAEVLELPQLLSSGNAPTDTRPVVYTPFGLSILDVAVAAEIHKIAARDGLGVTWDPRG